MAAAGNAATNKKGGAAVTADRHRTFFTPTGDLVATSNNDTRWGGVAGVGLEYGFAPNWSAAIEYDHLFMGNHNTTFTSVFPIAGATPRTDNIKQDVDLVTVRLNYKFGGPIIAKY